LIAASRCLLVAVGKADYFAPMVELFRDAMAHDEQPP